MNERFGSGFRSARARLSLLRAQFVFNRLLAHVRRNPQKFHHIVHTRREAQRFQLLGVSPESITTIPLSFLDDFTRGSVDLTAAKAKLIERWNIPPEAKVIGTFGFLSEYKGIEVAIRSLRHLPKDYHLMIVGGLHPEDIALRTIEQPYLRRLLAEISNDDPAGIPSAPSSNEVRAGRPHRRANKDLARRIHFCGSPGNQEFNQLLAGCDIVVLPYAEVGQTSSGPAALALDMQLPLICSRTNCFRELDRFEPGILSFFEIGNHIELAQRIALGDPFYPERVQARSRYVLRFNVELRAAAYLAACKRLSASVV